MLVEGGAQREQDRGVEMTLVVSESADDITPRHRPGDFSQDRRCAMKPPPCATSTLSFG